MERRGKDVQSVHEIENGRDREAEPQKTVPKET